MKIPKAAKRYVKAVFELARQQNQLEELAKDMEAAQQILEQHPDLITLLNQPVIPKSKKAAVLKKIFGEQFSRLFRQLIDLLIRRDRMELLPGIVTLFNEHYKRYQGVVEAQVTVATPIDDALKQQFIDKIKEITGKDKIELKVETDPSIIGGYILQIGDLRIDDSVKGKINKIKQKLIL